MNKIRFRYKKTGRAKYISHLDMMAALQRAFIRAGVHLSYSGGFNPHPYISCALPLSVGAESICELVDVAVEDGVIPDLRTIKLPEGVEINEVYTSARKFNDISWIEILVQMHYDNHIDDVTAKGIQDSLKRSSIIISKRTKRGSKELDIAPYIKDVQFCPGEKSTFKAKISAQNPTLNIDDIENAFDYHLKPDYICIKRIELYDSNMVKFN